MDKKKTKSNTSKLSLGVQFWCSCTTTAHYINYTLMQKQNRSHMCKFIESVLGKVKRNR